MYRIAVSLILCVLFAAPSIVAQEALPNSQLDPSQYDPETDPDIDLFIGNWKESMPQHMHGSLIVRSILTRNTGDPMHPPRKGAALVYTNSVNHVTLPVGASTTPDDRPGHQEIYYVHEGTATITSGSDTYDLREGNAFIITPRFDFVLTNTGEVPLIMYMVDEPIPEGETPNGELVVTDKFENNTGISVHWVNTDRGIISGRDGIFAYGGLTSVTINPMTMAQPHSHGEGVEEIWIALTGNPQILFGKQYRDFPAGSAYRIPSDGITAHANVNFSDEPVQFIHMMKSLPSESHKYGALESSLYDPDEDADYDMFMGNWRDSHPYIRQGCLIVRDVLTPNTSGDPFRPDRKAAALTDIASVSYALLEGHAWTRPTVLDDEQHIYYVMDGMGKIESGGRTYELREGIGVLVPPGVEFQFTNTGDEPLDMYLVVEDVPDGFEPNDRILVRDDREMGLYVTVHWVNIDRSLFSRADGLATLDGIGPVMLDTMTFAQPHSHTEGTEEVWLTLKGDARCLIGKKLREIPPGTAYRVPSDGMTAHANINITDRPIKLMWMMKTPH